VLCSLAPPQQVLQAEVERSDSEGEDEIDYDELPFIAQSALDPELALASTLRSVQEDVEQHQAPTQIAHTPKHAVEEPGLEDLVASAKTKAWLEARLQRLNHKPGG
jgi:hypothetical protein